MLKQIMIPVAAFAVTATGVSAFNSDMLDRIDVDLSDSQVAAFETAADMKESEVERSEIRAFLTQEVGEDTLAEVKAAVKEVKAEDRAAVSAAIDANDYNVFVEVAPDKLTEAITSEADFARFVEAKELKEAGDREGAAAIMTELGIEKGDKGGKHGGRGHRGGERATTTE